VQTVAVYGVKCGATLAGTSSISKLVEELKSNPEALQTLKKMLT
jgi:hypothetical protein